MINKKTFMDIFENKPFTVKPLISGVYNIEDAWREKPVGRYSTPDGKYAVNNCSDVYVVEGSQKIAIIDFSNPNDYVGASLILYRLVRLLGGGKPIVALLTHNHFDHVGLIDKFIDLQDIRFYVPENDFKNYRIFPEKKSVFLRGGESINLGDRTLKAIPLPGHTIGSMIYLLENEDIAFSGDAIGSGKHVWFFYENSVKDFILYANNFLEIYGDKNINFYSGHRWQCFYKTLDINYLRQILNLALQIENNQAKKRNYRSPVKFIKTEYMGDGVCIDWK